MGGASRVRLVLAAVLGLAAAVIASLVLWVGRRGAEVAANPLGFLNVSGSVRYVGDAACAACHAEIAESYRRTGMARSWAPMDEAEPIEDFCSTGPVVDQQQGYRYQVVRKDGAVWVVESRSAGDDQRRHQLELPIAYALGSGYKGRSYVVDLNGYLYLAPVSWYSTEQKWALSPGYEHSNQRFNRPVVTQCIACHNSYPQYVGWSEHRYEKPLPAGIGCERCHGPGELHVNQRRNDPPGHPRTGRDATIVNPAHLPSSLQQDICLQCHLSTEAVSLLRAGADALAYMPGTPLAHHRLDFDFTGEAGRVLSAVSHGKRVSLSRCFTQSAGKLTCTRCHDPHRPSWEHSRQEYRARCLECHGADACRRPASPPKALKAVEIYHQAHRADDCLACHMPRRQPKDIRHATTTDHWIRRHALFDEGPLVPDLAQAVPELVELADYFGVATQGESGIAHVMYGHRHRRLDYVSYGAALLEEAIRREPEEPRWLYWASVAAAELGQLQKQGNLLERVRSLLQEPRAQRRLPEQETLDFYLDLGHSYLQRGDVQAAEQLAREFLHLAPAFNEALTFAIRTAFQTDAVEEAEERARQATEQCPANANAWYLLASCLLRQNKNLDEARRALETAHRWEPDEPMVLVVLARVQALLGRYDEAKATLLAVLAQSPQLLEAYIGLAELSMELKDYTEAFRYYQQARDRNPAHPLVRRLAVRLEEARKGAGFKAGKSESLSSPGAAPGR